LQNLAYVSKRGDKIMQRAAYIQLIVLPILLISCTHFSGCGSGEPSQAELRLELKERFDNINHCKTYKDCTRTFFNCEEYFYNKNEDPQPIIDYYYSQTTVGCAAAIICGVGKMDCIDSKCQGVAISFEEQQRLPEDQQICFAGGDPAPF
jgi:hypothetical protein